MSLAGFLPKDDFSLDNYEAWYKGHRFGTMDDPLNADEHIDRAKWILSRTKQGAKVLDLGCLDGFMLMTLAKKKDITGVGIDLSKFGIGIAKTNAAKYMFPLKFINRPIEGLDLGERFDVIICSEVIEHVKDVSRLYEVIDRHLASNGIVLMDTPDYDTPMGRANDDPLHIRYYTHKLEHPEPDAISLPKEIGVDRIRKIEVVDQLIQVEYGN